MSEQPQSILFQVTDGVAVVTINRPERGNALDDAAREGIRAAWRNIEASPEIDVAIITATGDRHFCTGADVGRLSREQASQSIEEQRQAGPGGWSSRHYGVTKPVICAVNGIANGAGLHFAVEADIILGTRHAVFMDSHVNVGQVGALENIGLAKRLPLGTALRITLMGKKYRMGAERAYQLGLLDELYDSREQMMEGAMEMAKIISGNSPSAMKRSKEAIWQSLELPLAESLANGWNLICDQRSHPDAQEGLAAFKEKRPPNWQR